MSKVDLFQKALNEMTATFSSHDFYRKCREMGIMESYLSSGSATSFLSKSCNRDKFFKKVYHKKTSRKDSSPINEGGMMSESSCIEFLKNKGYKIYKYSEV